jgi:hypothetical protein
VLVATLGGAAAAATAPGGAGATATAQIEFYLAHGEADAWLQGMDCGGG